MRTVDRLRHFVRILVGRSRVDRDLRDELAHWTDELTARHLARGVPPETAHRLARADVGAVDALKQQVLDEHPAAAFRGSATDLRQAWRGLRRSPMFTAAVVVTLALGIGASTAIFTIVHALLLAPIPYRDSSRLVFIWEDLTSGGYPRAPLSPPELDDLRRRTTRFEGFGSIWATSATLTEGEPEQLRIGLVTTNFFDLLGVDAALGRTFGPADDEATGPSGILLSWSLFERRFGGDRSVVGRRLLVSGVPRTVLGVMPARFGLLLPPDVSRRLLAAAAAVPGVVAAAAISHVPFDDSPNWGGAYLSAPDQDASTAADADYRTVTPGFCEETGVRLLAGRFFTEADDPSTLRVAIVDDILAERAWPGQSALGKTLWVDPGSSGHPTQKVSVIGVVHHLRLRSVVADLTEQIFFAERQVLRNPVAFVVRSDRDVTSLAPALRHAIAQVDPLIPMADVRPFDAYTHEASASGRFTAALATVLALVALALASVGLYGVVAYGVVQRTREFAVRLALGARPGQLIGMALAEGAQIVVYGVFAGLALAVLAAHALRSQLFNVSPVDPLTMTAATVALAIMALAACSVPARRAARARPADALKTN
jgi:MacB-like periplasmic core domain/FtsX-like permease family